MNWLKHQFNRLTHFLKHGRDGYGKPGFDELYYKGERIVFDPTHPSDRVFSPLVDEIIYNKPWKFYFPSKKKRRSYKNKGTHEGEFLIDRPINSKIDDMFIIPENKRGRPRKK